MCDEEETQEIKEEEEKKYCESICDIKIKWQNKLMAMENGLIHSPY